ncbi:MAG: hypothetical protein IPH77_20965 [Ignavibacteria bacterium]|nr:hypothetical protein [Ignavibacteria bacterium]
MEVIRVRLMLSAAFRNVRRRCKSGRSCRCGDPSAVDNDAAESLSGYVSTDVNGDDFVDAGDVSIVDNNAALSVSVIAP